MTYEEAVMKITPGKYRHFKGNEYEVLTIARHSETTEPMVVYKALYHAFYLRFFATVEWKTTLAGSRVHRIIKVGRIPLWRDCFGTPSNSGTIEASLPALFFKCPRTD